MKKILRRNKWVVVALSFFVCFNMVPAIENDPIRTRDWRLLV
ncbi:hypothetical protein [Bacillus cihuensis]|nr:hypothetical protein [Bacillus cihuensis]